MWKCRVVLLTVNIILQKLGKVLIVRFTPFMKHLQEVTKIYQILFQLLLGIFKNIAEIVQLFPVIIELEIIMFKVPESHKLQ